MTALLLAAASAAVYGSADYCGGVATRRANPITVTVLSQLISVPLVVVGALLVTGTPTLTDLGWGALAGAAGLIGLVLLYRGLSRGAMAVVAPTTAVTAALVPLGVGLVLERWPRPLALAGVVCAVIAIGFVSLAPNGDRSPVTSSLLASAVLAGVAFGVFFIALDRAGSGAGLWPLVAARLTSVGLGTGLALAVGVSLKAPTGSWRWITGAGVLDVTANGLYVFAAQLGALAVIAPVASLYPASTVLLALTIDRERVRPVQLVGLGLAAMALVLVTGST
ncbi:MAG: EamA family transporter [Micromonosporaceae bacterium]